MMHALQWLAVDEAGQAGGSRAVLKRKVRLHGVGKGWLAAVVGPDERPPAHAMSKIKEPATRQSGRPHEPRTQAFESYSLLRELAGTLAHELNQPLTSILSNAQAAKRFLDSEPADLNEVRDILNDIVSEVRQATELIRWSRACLPAEGVRVQPLHLDQLVQDVLKALPEPLAEHQLVWQTQFPVMMPQVQCEPTHLREVLRALLLRAAEAASQPASERVIQISAQLIPWHEKLHLRIEAGGCFAVAGPAAISWAREPDRCPSLAVCQSLIRLSGGSLWTTDVKGDAGGTQFHLLLPVCR